MLRIIIEMLIAVESLTCIAEYNRARIANGLCRNWTHPGSLEIKVSTLDMLK